jgi:hypothetical protein
MRENAPRFNDYEQGPDFDRARSQIATPFQQCVIALDVAAVNQVYNLSGDFLYVDSGSTGSVTLELNNQYNDASAAFTAGAGFGIAALFKQVKLSWSAQAGKFIKLMYSTGDRVVPTNSTAITGNIGVYPTSAASYGAAYKSNTAMVANTPDTVFTPGANANGAIVWAAEFCSITTGSDPRLGYVAKNAAPATVLDGDLILLPTGSVGTAFAGSLKNPIKIAAGKGLYYITTGGDGAGTLRQVQYSLL